MKDDEGNDYNQQEQSDGTKVIQTYKDYSFSNQVHEGKRSFALMNVEILVFNHPMYL